MMQEQKAQLPQPIAAMEQRILHLERIIEVSQMLTTTLSLQPLLQDIIRVAKELTGAAASSILLVDNESGDLFFEAATGTKKYEVEWEVVSKESIAGWIVEHNEPLVIDNVNEDPRWSRSVDDSTGFVTHSVLGVPLCIKDRVIGAIEVLNKRDEQPFSVDDISTLIALAAQAAVAIENARLFQDTLQMKEFNEGLVQNMAEGIAVADAQGRLTFVNPAAATLLGYAAEELVGQRWTAIIPADQHSIAEASDERRVRSESDRYELELVHKDGRRIPVLVSGSPRFEKGRFAGTMAVFTDITLVLAHQKVEQELTLARQIQASFLPDDLPNVPGWQLAATQEPARQTSGDFYDWIPLPNGRLGVLIADVAGKGMGAALYMAMSRTLIRTYAVQYDAQPELVLSAANRHVLTDTHADLFVTVFYGILDPITGTLTYCNAGHNPPYLLSAQNGGAVQELRRTGIPLGMFTDMTWERGAVELAPGDVLVLYTDGITEARDREGAFFGEERLLEVVQASVGRSAQEMQAALLAEVHQFVGDVSQYDDITLMIVVRE